MNIRLDLNKRDFLTIAVLSVVFFSLAVWNLGLSQAPVNGWRTTENEAFYIDFGEPEGVGTVYFLVKNGSADVQAYTGSPGSWSNSERSISISSSYYSWAELEINSLTRYLRFDFQPRSSIELAEVALLNSDSQKIAIVAVKSEGGSDPNVYRLIDEQNLVQLPPTYLGETFFDEIYYVKTAEQYLKLQVAYEWTHPPLGKLIIASGISAFSFNPFGWRIMGVIFATLMIPMIYILGKKLFGAWIGGFASAFLLAFDFMHFTMARMATVDTYVVFFSLTSQLFFLIYLKNVLKNGWKAPVQPLFLAILFFALGFSTKWLVLYGFAAQLALLAALRLKEVAKLKKSLSEKFYAFTDPPFSMIVGLLLLAVLVYFLTYIPDILAGRSAMDVLGLQGAMYNYHSTLTATHAFASSWWTWPLMLKPLWLYVSNLPNNIASTIVLFGNPLVWWVGFACIIGISVVVLVEITRASGKRLTKVGLPAIFITSFFFFQWVPYILISRVTFIYHFFVNVPLLCLASAYFISKYWSSKWVKLVALAYFAGVVIIFGLFYFVISGMPTSNLWIDSLKWFSGWVF
ncbi:MAG: glycosyltransferase family 39 protein [Candidatus Bathyarchaeota archaeon]|nr:glycosyltransferase family 39 protein [Candidatus Bathyarchaeota archaeon]